MTPSNTSSESQPPLHPPVLGVALIAAEVSLRRDAEIEAVYMIASRDALTVLRTEPSNPDLAPVPSVAPFHVPHWAESLLASTEGVR